MNDEIDSAGTGLSATAKIMLAVIAALFGALLGIGLAVTLLVYRFEAPLAFGVGLLAGCALSAVKVILLEKALTKAVDMGKQKAQNYTRLQVIARYGLTTLVLLGAVLFPKVIGLFGIIAGILTLQLASYITGMIVRRRS